jgi:hypothetical protein
MNTALTLHAPVYALPRPNDGGEGVEMSLDQMLYHDAIVARGWTVGRVASLATVAEEVGVLLSVQQQERDPVATHYFIPLAELFHGVLHHYLGTECSCGHTHALTRDLVEERWEKLALDGWRLRTDELRQEVQTSAVAPSGIVYVGKGPTVRAAKYDLFQSLP